MDYDVRGWPLEKEAIRAKYYALVQKEKVLKSKSKKTLAYEYTLQHIPVHLSKSKSTPEAFSLPRSFRRAGLTHTHCNGCHSLPVSASSVSEATSSSHRSRVKNHGALSLEDVLAARVNVPERAKPMVKKKGNRTKFLAKQLKLISKNANTAPRRNIKILPKDTSEEMQVTFVADKMERDELHERIRVHACDPADPSNLAASSSRWDSPSRSPSSRTMSSSYSAHAHANSPSSIISDLSVPETVMSSVENELSDRKLTGFSITRERWTSREIFGSFDFGGELDIEASVAHARHPDSSVHFDHDRLDYCPDESLDSPSSGMRSPRQSLATSSQEWDDELYCKERGEHCGINRGRTKLRSPSSLFRDDSWMYSGDKPRSSVNMSRKLSRKLSTSFNKRRKQRTLQPHCESFSTRSSDQVENSARQGSLTLQIASLVAGYRVTSTAARNAYGAVQEAAVTAFQDEIAQLMLDRSKSNEIGDIEEFLDGYMRLQSPFYLEVVEDFFRTVSYDCYRRPSKVKTRPKRPKVAKGGERQIHRRPYPELQK